jgi:hypothetical protein
MNSRALHIHINRLSVEGLPACEQRLFMRALEKQLSALASGGLPGAFTGGTHHIAVFDAGRVWSGATAEQAARQVTTGLGKALAGKETRNG